MPESTLEIDRYANTIPNSNFWNQILNKNNNSLPGVCPYYYIYDLNQARLPKEKGEFDYYYYADIDVKTFVEDENYWDEGFYNTLREDGLIEEVPFDEVFYQYKNPLGNNAIVRFPREAHVDQRYTLSYSEFRSSMESIELFPVFSQVWKPHINGSIVVDNGGPESLIHFSRRLRYSTEYGIRRQDLWQVLNSSQAEFTLADIQTCAAKLGLNTQATKQTLSQLQKSGTPALLFLQDDGRIVTLTALDDDRAVVIDRGVTQNVERSVLENRYSGEALVPTKSLTQNASIVADDAVREVKLPSLDTEVPQQFVLHNTGTTPLTLQLEYPLLGVTESKLSRDTIPPGETATLDLKVKWRSVLKAPYQNVLVSLQANDPIAPRLQLAVLLVPPTNE